MEPDRPMASMATPRVAAGALFLDDAGRVLLVRPTYKAGWDIPGGYLDPDEAPREACAREVAEELGIRPPLGRLLVVDWAPDDHGDKLLFVFDGDTLDPAATANIVLQPDELDAHAFVGADDLDRHMGPRLVRRLTAALTARERGVTEYLEHGQRPDAHDDKIATAAAPGR
jgi:8-oxo-dGTP pyrophosphatase MutT (NUDIX family)